MHPSHSTDTGYVRYEPSMAEAGTEEAEVAAELAELLVGISEKTFADGHGALRSVHAKSHGLIEATLHVLPDLPAPLAQGLFAEPGSYRAVLRLSSTPGDLLADRVSTPRGVALRVFDVPGERLEGSESGTVQDVIMINGPTFRTKTAKEFLNNIKLLAKTTDKAERAKELASAFLRGAERALEAVGGESGAIKSLGGEPAHHPLGETYFTQVPLRFGDYVAKLQLAPVSPELTALLGSKVDLSRDDALREAVAAYFRERGGQWELRAQLCTDLEKMPIEDATVEWGAEASPYRTVARIEAAAQDSWSAANVERIDKGMAFSPWHGVQSHRPLGQIMRARKLAYEASQAFRASHLGRDRLT